MGKLTEDVFCSNLKDLGDRFKNMKISRDNEEYRKISGVVIALFLMNPEEYSMNLEIHWPIHAL